VGRLLAPVALNLPRAPDTERLTRIDFANWAGPHLARRGLHSAASIHRVAANRRDPAPVDRVSATLRKPPAPDIAAIAEMEYAAFRLFW
jgi:hypothetical protein